jgi:hypothetical protein
MILTRMNVYTWPTTRLPDMDRRALAGTTHLEFSYSTALKDVWLYLDISKPSPFDKPPNLRLSGSHASRTRFASHFHPSAVEV